MHYNELRWLITGAQEMLRLFGKTLRTTLLLAISLSLPSVAGAESTANGVRLIGNTWNQALIALPDNPKHAEFVAVGESVGNVKLHMLQTDCAAVEIGGRTYDLTAESGQFYALWLNEFLADAATRIDRANPYLTETVTFKVGRDGLPHDYKDDATIAKAGPFHILPPNMADITVRATLAPRTPTQIQALSIDFLK